MRRHPAPMADIPVSHEVFCQLTTAAFLGGSKKELWEIAAEAIDEWVRRHDPDAIAMPAATGYQWKSQFLPDGTVLRTVYGGKNYHCLVEGDHIIYNGQPVSPSGFVNAVGGIRRNAWRCTWILFPDSKEWKLADTLRSRARPHPGRPRKPADVLREPAAQPSADREAVTLAPDIVPAPAPAKCTAPDAANASYGRCATLEKARRDTPAGEVCSRPEAKDISFARPGSGSGIDRRMNGNAHIATLLRQELIPLLHRFCHLDGPDP